MTAEVSFLFPHNADHSVRAQRYFLIALDAAARFRLKREPLVARPFRSVEDKVEAVAEVAIFRKRTRLPFLRTVHDAAVNGRFVAEIDGESVRFAIDVRDQGTILDPDVLEWADVYFKANRWPSLSYDGNVRPLINGSGSLTLERIEHLKSLRTQTKDIDVLHIANVWGGREHAIRIFEQLGRLGGRNELHAVFPWGFPKEETDELKARLATAGIPATDGEIPLLDLWGKMARAKILFFRGGKHLCMSWRMLEMLAMGACIVVDATPFPSWYVPFRDDVNFVNCGLDRPPDTSPAPDDQYELIVPTIQSLLEDAELMAHIRGNNAAYFDDYAAPQKLGAHIVDELRAYAQARRR